MAAHAARKTFTVGAVAGVYAAEEIVFAGDTVTASPALTAVTALVETLGLATDATVELWLLKVGGAPATAGDWFASGQSITSGAETWPLASWNGAKIRVKSGGTAGSAVVSATAD